MEKRFTQRREEKEGAKHAGAGRLRGSDEEGVHAEAQRRKGGAEKGFTRRREGEEGAKRAEAGRSPCNSGQLDAAATKMPPAARRCTFAPLNPLRLCVNSFSSAPPRLRVKPVFHSTLGTPGQPG